MRCLLALLLLVLAFARPAAADEFRPAYLELTQTGAETYDVLWKLPALDEATTMAVRPVFPPGTVETSPKRSSFAAGTAALRWSVRVPGGLEGQALELDGLARSRIDVLARVQRSDGGAQLERIVPLAPRLVVAASPGPWEVALTYTRIGIGHILLGIDHLLFVLALLMIVRDLRMLLWTITAFTVAHSITLALATLGLIRLPGPPVEALIALSIVFVAAEIVARERGRRDPALHQPWLVAFAFGLLHGLGFAGALAEVGLPPASVPLGLLFFNVGVEIGQLLFVAAVLGLAWLLRRVAGERVGRRTTVVTAAYLIGTLASYWVVERVAAFVA
ncbi:MAG: HupE/UreJ family protein [Burkholderiales bacterium]|nr:HupE/UreJ family protein [Burkholderiales bacterium]